MPTLTRSNKRMNDYNQHFSRKKVLIPGAPIGLNNLGLQRTGGTTTVALQAVGDQVAVLKDINSQHVVLPRLTAANDEVCLWWQAPDDYYSGDNIHAWVLFANDGPTTTTVRVPYTMVYSAKKVVDYNAGLPAATGEAITEAASTLSTAISETIKMDGLTQYATYRGERGTINGGIIDRGDIVTFKIEAGTIVSNGTMSIVGIEIDYALRMRDESVIELYNV